MIKAFNDQYVQIDSKIRPLSRVANKNFLLLEKTNKVDTQVPSVSLIKSKAKSEDHTNCKVKSNNYNFHVEKKFSVSKVKKSNANILLSNLNVQFKKPLAKGFFIKNKGSTYSLRLFQMDRLLKAQKENFDR